MMMSAPMPWSRISWSRDSVQPSIPCAEAHPYDLEDVSKTGRPGLLD